MFQKNVPKTYWEEFVRTVAHLTNRVSYRVLGLKSLMQMFTTFFLQFNTSSKLPPKVFGCPVFVHIHAYHWGKLDPRALKCVFIRYSTQKWYKCFHPPTNFFFISRDVTFVEIEGYFSVPYLQGETSSMEDKDMFLLEFPKSSPFEPSNGNQKESKSH